MRHMTFVNRSDDREPQELADAIEEFIAEIIAAGVFVDGGTLSGPDGSHELRFSGGKILTTDGPFTEAKDIAGGYSMLECRSDEEAVAVIRKFLELHALYWPEVEVTVQIRRVVDAAHAWPSRAPPTSVERTSVRWTACHDGRVNERAEITAVWRRESARLTGALTQLTRDVDLAEDLTQDALVEALEQWPQRGIPTNPAAWLMTTAKRRAIDRFRRADALDHGRAFGPDVGLAILDHVELQGSSMLNAVHGELLVTAGRHHEAAAAFGTAANLTDNNAERELLRRRASAQQGHLTGER